MNFRANKSNPESNDRINISSPKSRGLPCGICGEYVEIFKWKICYRCKKILCINHTRRRLLKSDLPPQFRRGFTKVQFVEFCPECDEEIQGEEQEKEEEERQRQEELEEEEANRVITRCQLCAADDSPPEYKIFGYRPPTFLNCDRCGRLGCDNCISEPPDGHYEYQVICRECYQSIEQEEAREREEHWREREEEENKIEE